MVVPPRSILTYFMANPPTASRPTPKLCWTVKSTFTAERVVRLIEGIWAIAEDPAQEPDVRVRAASMCLDRVLGKPKQHVTVKEDLTATPTVELISRARELADRIAEQEAQEGATQ